MGRLAIGRGSLRRHGGPARGRQLGVWDRAWPIILREGACVRPCLPCPALEPWDLWSDPDVESEKPKA